MSKHPPRSHLARTSLAPRPLYPFLINPLYPQPLYPHPRSRLLTYVSPDRVKQCFEVNYFGSLRLIQTFLPALRKVPGQGARIVQISSLDGLTSGPLFAVNLWVGEVATAHT